VLLYGGKLTVYLLTCMCIILANYPIIGSMEFLIHVQSYILPSIRHQVISVDSRANITPLIRTWSQLSLSSSSFATVQSGVQQQYGVQ